MALYTKAAISWLQLLCFIKGVGPFKGVGSFKGVGFRKPAHFYAAGTFLCWNKRDRLIYELALTGFQGWASYFADFAFCAYFYSGDLSVDY